MKKLCLLAFTAFTVVAMNAQEVQFGATAGYFGVNARSETDGFEVSGSDSGFYVGFLADIEISEKFSFQPELLYANVNESSALFVPLIVKYYVAAKFSLQAVPQVGCSLEELPEDIASVNFSIGPGGGYDINENFFVEARYVFQVNNSYTGDLDITSREDYLNIGLGYKFN